MIFGFPSYQETVDKYYRDDTSSKIKTLEQKIRDLEKETNRLKLEIDDKDNKHQK
jgi:hypothetical protein